jgi:hypothetical protein
MRLNSTGKNPCGPLAGIRDRDRRPCEGVSKASATQPVVSARAASRLSRGADVRSAGSICRPDTFCAIPRREPAFLPHACAMISSSVAKRVELVFVPRMAGRSTPMTGTARSNLSYRTILILFVLLGAPIAARSGTLEDSAKELAGKIAAALPARDGVSVEVRNISSLAPDEVSMVEQTLEGELQNQGVRSAVNSTDMINVRVTLSESIQSFLWAAEITQGDALQVILLAVPRSSEDRIVSNAMPMTLRSEKFWEGSQRILDATLVNESDGGHLLLLLTQDGLLIRKVGSDAMSVVPIPFDPPVTRDPTWATIQTGNGITVRSVSQICRVDGAALRVIECHPTEGPPPGRVYEKIELGVPGPMHVERGSQIAAVQSVCRGGELYIAAGAGDYTEPDTIQLFESTIVNGIIVEKRLSDRLHFTGPVIALQFAGTTPRAIVHNLRTGNYEAYRISIACEG